MANTNFLSKKVSENLDTIKCQISDHWNQFTNEQINLITDYESLVNQLKLTYRFSEITANAAIIIFMEKLGLISMEIYIEHLRHALMQSTNVATLNMRRVLERCVDIQKNKQRNTQSN
jgi:hypothetical protein